MQTASRTSKSRAPSELRGGRCGEGGKIWARTATYLRRARVLGLTLSMHVHMRFDDGLFLLLIGYVVSASDQ